MISAAIWSILLVYFSSTNAKPSLNLEKRFDGSCIINGVLYQHAKTFSLPGIPCTKYQCSNGFVEHHSVDCMDNYGRCHEIGTTWEDGCGNYTCHANGHNGWKTTYQAGCRSEDGRCHPVNSRFTSKCATYQCSSLPLGGSTSSLLTTMCEDVYGKCYDQGSEFAYVIGGRLFNRCSCSQNGGSIQYKCY